jgi:hypothetical protein
MGVGRLALTTVLTMAAAGLSLALAQSSRDIDPAFANLHPSPLVLWVVLPATTNHLFVRLPPPGPIQTAGSIGYSPSTLGVPASSIGKNASDVGSSPSGIGQSATNVGKAASDTGYSTSGIGQQASNVGKNASDVGQTAGSFGHSLDTIAASMSAANGYTAATTPPAATRDPAWDTLAAEVQRVFPPLQVSVDEVEADQLQDKLASVAGSKDAPDVLLGTPLPALWSDSGMAEQLGVTSLGRVNSIQQFENDGPASPLGGIDASILLDAPHPEAARAFVVWFGGDRCLGCGSDVARETQTPVALAKNVLHSLLNGAGPGSAADPAMATFNAGAGKMLALAPTGSAQLGGIGARIDVVSAQANQKLAVVELRAIVDSGKTAFGVVHAMVVLRTDDSGRWKVLQITPNLQAAQQVRAWQMLQGYGTRVRREQVAQVQGVSLAAPLDGENRAPQPELWWDNHGGATLQIVEWQIRSGNGWLNSNLFFIPDANSRLRTRVTANFASHQGEYRWRVWSVGAGGALSLSPWRGFNIT